LSLEYESLNQRLLERLPALGEPRYTQMIGGIEAGPYVVFGVTLNRYLIDLADESDPTTRAVVSAFLEEMATARDGRVTDMLSSEVLPTLVRTQSMVDVYWPLLGEATRHRISLLPSRLTSKVELPSHA